MLRQMWTSPRSPCSRPRTDLAALSVGHPLAATDYHAFRTEPVPNQGNRLRTPQRLVLSWREMIFTVP